MGRPNQYNRCTEICAHFHADDGSEVDLGELQKIDSLATDGLAGVNNSLAYRVHELEKHFHSYERWYGLAGAPTATHKADRIGTTSAPFIADAGNNTWGSWLQVLGSEDTPAVAGMVKFDFHQIEIVSVERQNNIHFIQIAYGASGAAGLAANEYTEFVFIPQSASGRAAPIPIIAERQDAGELAWVRLFVPTQNTGTMSFFIGIHEYVG